jgi:hypothetical protein
MTLEEINKGFYTRLPSWDMTLHDLIDDWLLEGGGLYKDDIISDIKKELLDEINRKDNI